MTYEDLQKIVKKKEDVLVSNDTMKLEIKKIRENLSK
jgi:regulator of replication initiation timing